MNMARRKNKKTGKNQNNLPKTLPQQPVKADVPPAGPKTRTAVGIPVFFAGMFLSLVLGIYLGTLLPEISRGQETVLLGQRMPETQKPENPPSAISAPANNAPKLPPRYASEAKTLMDALIRDPASVKAWIQLGNLYFDAQMPKESIDAYSHALALEPSNADVLTDMGVMYRELGDYAKAVECFRSASKINPRHAESLYNAGLVLSADLHDAKAAREAWEKLLRINPNAVSPHGQPVLKMIEELK